MLAYVMIHFECEKDVRNYMFLKQSFLISKTIQNIFLFDFFGRASFFVLITNKQSKFAF